MGTFVVFTKYIRTGKGFKELTLKSERQTDLKTNLSLYK